MVQVKVHTQFRIYGKTYGDTALGSDRTIEVFAVIAYLSHGLVPRAIRYRYRSTPSVLFGTLTNFASSRPSVGVPCHRINEPLPSPVSAAMRVVEAHGACPYISYEV